MKQLLNHNYFVIGSDDNNVSILNTKDYTTSCVLTGHTQGVRALETMKNGDIISGSMDQTIRIWSVEEVTWRDFEDDSPVYHEYDSIRKNSPHKLEDIFKSDFRLQTIIKYDHVGFKPQNVLKGHEGPVFCLRLLPNERLVSGSGDHTLRIWNVVKGSCLNTLESHSRDIKCIEIIPQKHFLLSGGNDLTIKMWDYKGKKSVPSPCLQTFTGHSDQVTTITWISSLEVFVTGSHDSTCRVWSLDCVKPKKIFNFNEREVISSLEVGKGLICTSSMDHTLTFWVADNGRVIRKIKLKNEDDSYTLLLLRNLTVVAAGKLKTAFFYQ